MSDWLNPGIGADGGASWAGDQAAGLRRLFGGRSPQVVAFVSGREACGRTTLLVQTAAALAASGRGVLILDENPAPSNAISAFGLTARHDLFQVLQGERSLHQTMLQAAPMLGIMPAARAARELDNANRSAAAARRNLAACLQEMQHGVGFVLVDTAIRRGGHLSPLALAARHMAVVVAAQGAAITHAYALIKRIAQERGREGFQIVITRARSREEARAIFDNMRRVAHEHLNVRLDYLGASLAPVTEHLADALLQRLPPAFEDGIGGGFVLPAADLTGNLIVRAGQVARMA
ncbi:MAG: AAA family ATPase [Betaproteobacteria bacterium]|nr:AAA family ATPase [Betaproteobacteria bacterium]